MFHNNYSAICKKPLKRLEETIGETSSTGLKSGVNEKIHLLHKHGQDGRGTVFSLRYRY